jgi:hypothetical protein
MLDVLLLLDGGGARRARQVWSPVLQRMLRVYTEKGRSDWRRQPRLDRLSEWEGELGPRNATLPKPAVSAGGQTLLHAHWSGRSRVKQRGQHAALAVKDTCSGYFETMRPPLGLSQLGFKMERLIAPSPTKIVSPGCVRLHPGPR